MLTMKQNLKKKKILRSEKGLLQLEYHKIVRILSYHRKELNKKELNGLVERKNQLLKIFKNKYEMK